MRGSKIVIGVDERTGRVSDIMGTTSAKHLHAQMLQVREFLRVRR